MPSIDNIPDSVSNGEILYIAFHYYPSRILAYVGIAVFAVLALLLIQTVRRAKAPVFMIKIPVLAILECVGFVMRVQVINGQFSPEFIIMSVFLLIAPNLLSLANFNCLIHVVGLADIQSEKFYYRPKVMSKILSLCTLSCSALQAAGSGLVSKADTKNAGYVLLFVGLALQFCVYLVYIYILNYVHKNPKFDYQFQGAYNPKQSLIYYLYITTGAFVIRNVYRIVQYVFTVSNHPFSYEWTYYVFDALMVAICFALFCIIPRFFPKQDQKAESESNTYLQDPAYNIRHPPYNSESKF